MQVVKLPPGVVLGHVGTGGVRSNAHGNTGFQTGLSAAHNAVHYDFAVVLLQIRGVADGLVKKGKGQGRGDGGHKACSGFFEQVDGLLVRHGTMLNGVHAVFQRGPNALGAFHMGGDLKPQLVGFVTGGPDNGRIHFQYPRLSLFYRVQHPTGDHEFDQVRLGGGDVVNAFLCLCRSGDGVGQRTGHVASRYGNGHIARQNPGSDFAPGVDFIPQLGIKVQNAAYSPDGGDAGEQLLLGKARHHGLAHFPGQGIGGNKLHGLYRVCLLLFGLAASGQVDVEIDQSRQYILPL